MNMVKDVTCSSDAFSHLQTLNLSYNSISTTALVVLGCLPSLMTLYLTGNNLVTLPPEMATPFRVLDSEK